MNSREKQLLIFLGIAIFVIVHLAAYKLYFVPQRNKAKSSAESYRAQAQGAEAVLDLKEEMKGEIDWLEKYEPQPIVSQKAESELENFANSKALEAGLNVKRRKLQTRIQDPALSYHRARVELEVSGSERVLYRWLDTLHSPADFRAVTFMYVSPKKDDLTIVDCRVTVEKWFIPDNSEG